jgi:hypothetical protein
VNPGKTAGRIAPGFIGLSFEKTHLTNGTLTADNAPLIALFKLLGAGVLRIGAGDVDKTTWQPNAMPVSGPPFPTVVGTAEVDALAGFLSATGWRVIYGVNLKTGTPMNSAAEAKYANGKLGASLYGFEIGNDFDQLGTWAMEKPTWESFANALLALVPGAPLMGPGADPGAISFATSFAQDEASKLVLLTHHYYRGSGGTSSCTIANLLAPDATLVSRMQSLSTAATANKLRDGWRMGETNSCNHHGGDGVSNAFASALWSIDYIFVNATNGSSGVNFHGGEVGMDGTTPFLYAPIGEALGKVTGANPLFYGLLFMSLAGNGNVLTTTANAGSLNFSAYAIAQTDGSTNVILVNKDAMQGVSATVDVGAEVKAASGIYLQAASLGATSGVTLAGVAVSASGAWNPGPPFALSSSGNAVTAVVPPGSAVLVHAR